MKVFTITEHEILSGLHDYGWDEARTCIRCGTTAVEAMNSPRKSRCKGKRAVQAPRTDGEP